MFKLNQSLQEIFDTVCRHLDQQGHRATVESKWGPSCKYRMNNGDRCAVGCLIPDEHYNFNMESQTVNGIFGVYLTCTTKTLELLEDLQQAHDAVNCWGDVKRRLTNVGQRYKLNLDVLNSLSFIPR